MCAECRHTPCHPACPNAPEPAEVYTCNSCKEPIREGDEYLSVDGFTYHKECARCNAYDILIEDLEAIEGIAELDE